MTGGFLDECHPFQGRNAYLRRPVALPPAIELVAFGDPWSLDNLGSGGSIQTQVFREVLVEDLRN